jgi:hypothetical protein
MNSPIFWALDPLLRAHAKIFIADVHRLSHIPGFAGNPPFRSEHSIATET